MAYPVVAASSTYNGDLAATHNLTLPTGTVAGSKVLIFAAEAGLSGVVIAIEHAATQGEVDQGYIVYSPTSTDAVAAVLYRVTGAAGFASTPDEAGTGTQPDPPSAGTASGDVLWISAVSWIGDIAHSSYSANYSGNQRTARFADATNGVGIAVCTRNLTDSSDDPGTHTIASSTDWGAITVTISSPDAAEGSGSCVGVGLIVGAGRCTRSGSGIVACVGVVVGAGRCIRSGSGSCNGTDGNSGGGKTIRSGGGACVGVGAIVGTGRCTRSGSGTVDGSGVIVGTGRCTRSGSGSCVGVGVVGGSGRTTRSGSGTVSAVGSIMGVGYQPRSGSGTVVCVGTLFGSSSQTKSGSGTVAAVGTLFGGGCACSGSGSIAGVGVIVGAGRCTRSGSGSVIGAGVIIGAGASDLPEGSGAVAGVGVVVGAGRSARSGSGAIASVGTIVGTGQSTRSGSGTVLGVGVIVGAASSDHPAGSGPVAGVGAVIGAGRSTRSGSASIAAVGVVVGAGLTSRFGSGPVVGVGVIVGASGVEQPDGSGSVAGVGVVVGTGKSPKVGSGTVVGIASPVGAATLSRCTLGTVDIFVNPNLVTVTNPAGFTVGRAVRFKNAAEINVDLLATITAVSGNQVTLSASAGVSVTDEICFISTSGKWFGPGGEDCGCGCGNCYCEDAARHFNDSQIAISDMAGAGSPLDAMDIAKWNCEGRSPVQPMQTWTFPGLSDESLAIDNHDDCYWGIASSVEIGTALWFDYLDISGWGGDLAVVSPGTCGVRTGLAAGLRKDSTIFNPRMHAAGVFGEVYYRCVDGQKERVVSITAGYAIHDHFRFTAIDLSNDYPDWTWTQPWLGAFVGKHTADGVEYIYELREILYAGMGGFVHQVRWYDLKLYATSTTQTTIDLSDAPSYFDPFGILRGVVTVT